MGVTFEKSKRQKLQRLPVLRIMNALGMVAWKEEKYSGADQKLRLVHPLTWAYLLAMIFVSLITQGVPETVKETKCFMKDSAVWF
jgi:hypothetical protein